MKRGVLPMKTVPDAVIYDLDGIPVMMEKEVSR